MKTYNLVCSPMLPQDRRQLSDRGGSTSTHSVITKDFESPW